MVNGTELYLLRTWCCTKWHINHPLPSPFSILPSDFCPSDQIMLLVVQPSSLTHICFSIQIIAYGYLQNYLYCNIKRDLKSHRDLSLKGKKGIWLWLPLTLGERMGSETPLPVTFQASYRTVWRQHNGAKQRNTTGLTQGERANEGENVRQNQGLRWHCLGKTLLGLLY